MSSSYQCTKKVIALTKLKKKHRKTYDYPLRKKLMVKGVEKKAGEALSSEIDAMLIKIQERQAALTAELEANKVRLEEAKQVRLKKAKKLRLEEAIKLRLQEASIECHPTMKATTSNPPTVSQQSVTPSTEQQRIPATSQTRQSETDNQDTVEDSDDYTR